MSCLGKKYRYLGLWPTEVEAAVAYDVECVRQKGLEAMTNFDISSYSSVLAEHYEAQTKSSGKRKLDEPQKFTMDSKTSERHFRAQLASKHAELVASALTAPAGPACEADPSADAIDTVRLFFDAEEKIRGDRANKTQDEVDDDYDYEDDDVDDDEEIDADDAIKELQNIVREARSKSRLRTSINQGNKRRR